MNGDLERIVNAADSIAIVVGVLIAFSGVSQMLRARMDQRPSDMSEWFKIGLGVFWVVFGVSRILNSLIGSVTM